MISKIENIVDRNPIIANQNKKLDFGLGCSIIRTIEHVRINTLFKEMSDFFIVSSFLNLLQSV